MEFPKNFTIANEFTKKWEKGYVNHPNDPGGATYNGVSLRFIKDSGIDINGDGRIDIKDILTLYKNKDQAKVDEIFWKAFWRDAKVERLTYLPVQTVFYDTAVNTGRTQTAKFLQRACNEFNTRFVPFLPALVIDGIIGTKTLERVHSLSKKFNHGLALAIEFCNKRMDFHNMLVNNSPYKDGRNYRPFAVGWRNRVNDLIKYIKTV